MTNNTLSKSEVCPLSFICTVKNGERYLDECIQSVVEHYPDAEFVIVDDGSTDGTPEILKRWAAAEPKIRVISTGGVGRGAALNMAVEACTRPYIANIDADDVALPGRDKLLEVLDQYGEDVAVVAGTATLLFENTGKLESAEPLTDRSAELPVHDLSGILHRGNPILHISVVMRREIIRSIGGYEVNRKSQLDYNLWVRIVRSGYRILYRNENVALKRLHEHQSFEHGRYVRNMLRAVPMRISAANTARDRVEAITTLVPQVLWGALPRRFRLSLMSQPAIRRVGAWIRGVDLRGSRV